MSSPSAIDDSDGTADAAIERRPMARSPPPPEDALCKEPELDEVDRDLSWG